jgi:hypothetical protein
MPVAAHQRRGARRIAANIAKLPELLRFQHAEDCAQKAAAQTDPQTKADFLDLERRWLVLARSYDASERLTDFSGETNTERG